MLEGIKALLSSEKAIAAGFLVFLSGVFVLMGKMTVDAWQNYTQWVLVTYVAGKTIQGSVSALASTKTASLDGTTGGSTMGSGKGGG